MVEILQRGLDYGADTDGAVCCIVALSIELYASCLAAMANGNLDLANQLALGLSVHKKAIAYLEKTRYGG